MGGVVASQEYELQLQLALLRTVAAVLRSEPNANLEPIHREILAVDSSINALPSQERPILTLASRLGWSPIETDFVWVTVALATELVHWIRAPHKACRSLCIAASHTLMLPRPKPSVARCRSTVRFLVRAS